jgi:hypothetical protein
VAKTFNSEIILLHVIPKVSGFPTAVGNLKKKVTEQLQDIQSGAANAVFSYHRQVGACHPIAAVRRDQRLARSPQARPGIAGARIRQRGFRTI